MDKDIRRIKSQSFLSVSSLIFQSSYSAALGFIAFFILTVKSGVYLLGIYNTVLATMNFFNYFTNLGLAAAIIQKKEVEEIDLNSAFYIQFFLTALAVFIGFLISDRIIGFYKDLPPQAVYLYWAILVSFLLLSFKTIPSVLLEKNIEIYKVVLSQAIENTVFYACIIVFSLLGWEIFSLVIAVILRSLVGVISIFMLKPWLPKIQFSFSRAKSLLKYGLAFQGNSFLSLIKDDLLIIYLGGVVGLKNLGYISFAKKYAEFSIRLITDNINRVAFPLFSRFQKEPPLLKKSLSKVFDYETLLIFPMIIGLLFVFDSFLKVYHNYFLKWQPAMFSFYFFSLSAFFVSLYTPFINLFNAIGKVKISLVFMVIWIILTWTLIPIGIRYFSYNGVSIAFFAMSLTFFAVYFTARRYTDFSFMAVAGPNLLSSIVMACFLFLSRYLFTAYYPNVYAHLAVSFAGGAGAYLGTLYLIKGKLLLAEIKDLLKLKNG